MNFVKLFTYLALAIPIAADFVENENKDISIIQNTAFGIFRSILDHRDFGSNNFVKFSEWESPEGDLYVVPTTDKNIDDNSPALGLGYKLINNDDTVVSSLDISNILQIKEENITAAGFPFKWSKHEEKTADDFFPFGSKKFMMIGVNKESFDNNDFINKFYNNDNNEDSIQLVTQFGLFSWFEEEDDCNVDEKTNKLFDTDHFLFVGVGSINNDIADNNNWENIMKRELSMTTEFITLHKTKTITSIQQVTVTETIVPSWIPDYDDETDYEDYDEDYDEIDYTLISSDGLKSISTSTHKPFIFDPITETNTPDTFSSTLTSDLNNSILKDKTLSINSDTTLWDIPKTWNSYPFSSTDDYQLKISQSTVPVYMNSTTSNGIITSSSISLTKSTLEYNLYTASYYGNNSMNSSIFLSNTDKSIYTRTKIGNLSVVTSENIANNNIINNGYWASVSAFVFAILSGILLI